MEKLSDPLLRAPEGLIRPVAAEGEEWPRVGFDVRLGKTFSSVDFDTEGYADYLRSRGLNAQEVALAHLEFRSPSRFKLQGGEYDYVHNRMEVDIAAKSKEDHINDAVYHETEHYIDALDGRLLGPLLRVRRETVMSSRLLSVASFIFWSHALVAQDVVTRSQEIHNTLTALQMSLLCTLGSMCLYMIDPSERRARKVEQAPALPLASFEAK